MQPYSVTETYMNGEYLNFLYKVKLLSQNRKPGKEKEEQIWQLSYRIHIRCRKRNLEK